LKTVGIIAEYNPFHNGHLYHINEAKKQSDTDCAVVIMSGNFLQRGEPALVSKWARTAMALKAGADVVIELPFLFAVGHADTFAYGAINLLESLSVSSLCFGSEHGDISAFLKAAEIARANKPLIEENIKAEMKKGSSYPNAVTNALTHFKTDLDLSQPNNILGFSYVKEIQKLGAKLAPFTIQRKSADYHDESLPSGPIASATSIRKNLFSNQTTIESLSSFTPLSTVDELQKYKKTYKLLHNWEAYFSYLQHQLFILSASELKSRYEMEEGMEYRFLKMMKEADSFQALMTLVKNKRYTWTRLQRMCLHILMNTNKEEAKALLSSPPPYARLLGMTKQGKNYLNTMKKSFEVPLVSAVSKMDHPLLNMDITATRVYSLPLDTKVRQRFFKQEYTTPPIQL